MAGQRLVALDVFRGLSIAAMILVNNPGSWNHVYAPLRHADWNGCTPTDLIFPFFLIAVGLSMAFSFGKFEELPKPKASRTILKRAGLIFLVGILLHAFPFYNLDVGNFRIMGVMQRIGICFALAGLLVLFTGKRLIIPVTIIVLLGYWAIFVVFGDETPFDKSNNIARNVDLALIGKAHMWNGLGFAFDPEGLLGSVSATANVLIGYGMGILVKNKTSINSLLIKLCLIGAIFIGIGLLWGQYFPINKSLWTSSYVLYSSGCAALVLALIIWLADVMKLNLIFKPFVVYGTNPLALYVFAWILSVLLASVIQASWFGGPDTSLQNWIFSGFIEPVFGPKAGSLIYAISFVVISWLVGLCLYKKKIFIKL